MKLRLLFICSLGAAQNLYQGEITFDYSGTVNGSFSSTVQDSNTAGFAFNQEGTDTSYFIMAAITEQEDGGFDLFFTLLQDTTFPVQPRTWNIPGQGDLENPLSLETIVVLMPGLDSAFVAELFAVFTDTTGGDSLNLDTLLTGLFLGLSSNLYLGLAGEMEISEVTDSTLVGGFYATLIKPEIHIPPHMVMINNGGFVFSTTSLPVLTVKSKPKVPEKMMLFPAYPNPFNPVTAIRFSIETYSNGSLRIFDITGRMVESLINKPFSPGEYEIEWYAGGRPSGVYFAVLQTGNFVKSTKLVLMK